MSTSFIEHFSQLRDPRVERHKRYPLMEILLLAVCAMLSGAQGWEAVERRVIREELKPIAEA